MNVTPITQPVLLAAATVLDTVDDSLGTIARSVAAGTDVADPSMLAAFDDAYVQADTAAKLLDTSRHPVAASVADAIRGTVIGTIQSAKATAMDTVVDAPTVLELVSAARNEALALAQELRATTTP